MEEPSDRNYHRSKIHLLGQKNSPEFNKIHRNTRKHLVLSAQPVFPANTTKQRSHFEFE